MYPILKFLWRITLKREEELLTSRYPATTQGSPCLSIKYDSRYINVCFFYCVSCTFCVTTTLISKKDCLEWVDENKHHIFSPAWSRSYHHEEPSHVGSSRYDLHVSKGKAQGHSLWHWPRSSTNSYSSTTKPKRASTNKNEKESRWIGDSLICDSVLNTNLSKDFVVANINLDNYDELSDPRKHVQNVRNNLWLVI